MKLDYVLTLHMNKFKIKIGEANIISETMKIVQENTGSKISDIACRNVLLAILYLSRQGKQKKNTNKRDYIKLKSFCTAKEIIDKIKTTHRMGEHICRYI